MSTLGSVGITCFAWLLVLSPWTAAEAQITAIKLGVAEHLRLGEWAAVTVELAPQQELSAIARLEVESTDGDGAPAVYDQAPIRDSQNARSLVGWFRLGGTRGEVRVRLKDAGGQVLAEDSTFVAADEGSG
ncbi:MAG: hypothetical protein ACK53V_16130, partial [Planctomycetota bacterium]